MGWMEWAQNKFLSGGLKMGGMHWIMEDSLMQRFFSQEVLEAAYDLIDTYSRDFNRVPPPNICKIINTANSRPNANFRKAEFDIIIFLGRQSNLYDSGLAYYAELNPAKCELVEFMEGTHLLTVQAPQLLIPPLRLFLQGQGLRYK